MAPVVDIHCHTFNADDLPVRGFVQRVAFHDHDLGADIAALVDVLIQASAPGYLDERRQLDALLGEDAGLEAPMPALGADLDAEVEVALSRLQASEPELLQRVAVGFARDEELGGGEEGLADLAAAGRRAIRWVKLFGMSRLAVTSRLVANFGDRVDLFTPLLVDLGMGLYDSEGTTMRQQVELHEKISRLSMLGRLPGVNRARIHPFLGFDPRRQLQASGVDVETPLELCRNAVEQYGFIGIKLYPPMGWQPIGNEPDPRSAFDPEAVDDVLRQLYAWCEAEDVPLTAHCAMSNAAHRDYLAFSSPERWRRVLAEFPGLHLNLGHFGGARADEPRDGWPWAIARLATDDHRYLFADVGNHRIDRDDVARGYLDMLEAMFGEPTTAGMKQRVMYGSDWYMLAALPDHEEFLDNYESLYRARFGDAATDDFLGGNALRFLGFDDATNKNAKRLRARYEKYAPGSVPGWLASP